MKTHGGIITFALIITAAFLTACTQSPGQAPAEISQETLVLPTPFVTKTPQPSLTPTTTLPPSPTLSPTVAPTATPAPPFSWRVEPVRTEQAVGYFSSLVIDDKGQYHLAFFQDNYDIVWYGVRDKSGWEMTDIVGGLGRGMHLSLALDGQGNPHIAYHTRGSRKEQARVWYSTLTTNGWQFYQIYQSKPSNTDISLALGPDRTPHISYLDKYSFVATYAHMQPGGGWEVIPLGSANPDCQSFPIQVDGFGNVHMLYQTSEGGLVYAKNEDENWSWIVIDEQAGAGYYSALALDSVGAPHVAYYNQTSGYLYYAYLESGDWVVSEVDHDGDVGGFPSIAVDENGKIHISYYDVSNEDLKYAYGQPGFWHLEVVSDDGDVGQWNSLALDKDGLPRISFLDQGREDLFLAIAMPRIGP